MNFINPLWNIIPALLLSIFVTHAAVASAYYQNKILKDKDSDINITIMRWGVPDQEGGLSGPRTDRIIGQIASTKYEQATLIFETNPINNKKYQLIINTPVHAYRAADERSPSCTICGKGRNSSYSGGNNATGALTSGGCYFEFFFPRDTAMGKLRLVDVRCRAVRSHDSLSDRSLSVTDGESVTYFTNFNISPDLARSPLKIPIAQKITLHTTPFSLNLIDAPNSEKKPEPEEPASAVAESTKDTAILESPVRTEAEGYAKKLVDQHQGELSQLCSGYISALTALEKRSMQSANLKSVVEIQAEKARFAESKDVPAPAATGNTEIRKLQAMFQTKQLELRKQMDERILKLAQSYQIRLKALQDEHTKGGRIEEALKFNAEIERVKANPYHLVKVEITNEKGLTKLNETAEPVTADTPKVANPSVPTLSTIAPVAKQITIPANREVEDIFGSVKKGSNILVKTEIDKGTGSADLSTTAEPVSENTPKVANPSVPTLSTITPVAKQITIPANREAGYIVGPVKKGSNITLSYISGKWKSWGFSPTENPDSDITERGDAARLVIACQQIEGQQSEILAIVPAKTAQNPFTYTFTKDYDKIFLRINNCPGRNGFDSNPGGVVYCITHGVSQVIAPAAPKPFEMQPSGEAKRAAIPADMKAFDSAQKPEREDAVKVAKDKASFGLANMQSKLPVVLSNTKPTKENFEALRAQMKGKTGKVKYAITPTSDYALKHFPENRDKFSDRNYPIPPMDFEPAKGITLAPPIWSNQKLTVTVKGLVFVHLYWEVNMPPDGVERVCNNMQKNGWLLLEKMPYTSQHSWGGLKMVKICKDETFILPLNNDKVRVPTLIFSTPDGEMPEVTESR